MVICKPSKGFSVISEIFSFDQSLKIPLKPLDGFQIPIGTQEYFSSGMTRTYPYVDYLWELTLLLTVQELDSKPMSTYGL